MSARGEATQLRTFFGSLGIVAGFCVAGLASAADVDFGPQSMGTTSAPRLVIFTNDTSNPIDVTSVVVSDPAFAQVNDCDALAPGAGCTIELTFTPSPAPGAINSASVVSATLTISSTDPASPRIVTLEGSAEKSLVTHFYQAILRRAPDAQGKAFWAGEALRLQDLGADVNETWFAMAAYFFFSPEYLALARDDAGFLQDLYRTFFNRAAESAGLAFWTGQLSDGLPREVALASFMFSAEFEAFTQGIFGSTAARPEVDVVMDLYRGLLARLPDASGLGAYVSALRQTQCAGTIGDLDQDFTDITGSFVESPEYVLRARSNGQFVGDLYNAFLRRGGDLAGVQYWIGQLDSGAMTRDAVRAGFRGSAEFSARVDAVAAAGCFVPGTITTLPTAAITSLAATLGADGLPVIAFGDNTTNTTGYVSRLNVLKCGDAACSSGNVMTNIETIVGWGDFTEVAVAIGADGFPVLAYVIRANHSFPDPSETRVAKCADGACSGGTVIHTVLPRDAQSISLAIGADTFPVLALEPLTSLTVLKCGDAACATGNALTGVLGQGERTAIGIGNDGLPLVIFDKRPSVLDRAQGLRALKCGNASCTAGNALSILGTVGVTGYNLDMATGTGGLPMIAYGSGGIDLRWLQCADEACSSVQAAAVLDPDAGQGGQPGGLGEVSLAMGANGRPVAAYQSVFGVLKMAFCDDPSCSTSARRTFHGLPPIKQPTVLIGGNGLPVIVHAQPGSLNILACDTESCQ